MSIDLVADVNDLRTSLQWGQPAFTIIDVRDRSTYNQSRITGAISIPLNDLESRAGSLYRERQTYIYGENDTRSNFKDHTSYTTHHTSSIKHQASRIMYHTSRTHKTAMAPGMTVSHQTPNIKHQTSLSKHHASHIKQ